MENKSRPIFLRNVLSRDLIQVPFYGNKLLISLYNDRGDDEIWLVLSGSGFIKVGKSHCCLTEL